MLSPLNAAFGAVALAATVIPLVHPAPKEISEQDRLAAAFDNAGATLTRTMAPPDVLRYQVAFPDCAQDGALVLAGYGRRIEVREIAAELGAQQSTYFSGAPTESLDEQALTRAYILDQLASKFGFRLDGPWSRRLTVFDPPQGCKRPVSLVMNVDNAPAVRRELQAE